MDVRQEAAERILNRGVRFRLPAPLFSRLLKLNQIVIKPLFPGTILEFATVVLENNLEEAIILSRYEVLVRSIKPIARCMAIAMLNDEKKIAERSDELQKWLMWKVKPELLVNMFLVVSRLNRTADFMNITKYFVIQTSMMMNPNLGQETNGR